MNFINYIFTTVNQEVTRVSPEVHRVSPPPSKRQKTEEDKNLYSSFSKEFLMRNGEMIEQTTNDPINLSHNVSLVKQNETDVPDTEDQLVPVSTPSLVPVPTPSNEVSQKTQDLMSLKRILN